jgi:hypothetical protein
VRYADLRMTGILPKLGKSGSTGLSDAFKNAPKGQVPIVRKGAIFQDLTLLRSRRTVGHLRYFRLGLSMKSSKSLLIVFALLLMVGCVSPPDPSQIPTTKFKGETAFLIVGSKIFSRSPQSSNTEPPAGEELTSAAHEAEVGTHPTALPFQASAACPNGHKVVAKAHPVAEFYMVLATGQIAYRVSRTFTVMCR